jgi:predicted ATPase
MKMLKTISLNNFRSFRDVSVSLKPINVLIGGNGAGKSNFISLFSMLEAIEMGRLSDWVAAKGFDNLLFGGIEESSQFTLRLDFDAKYPETYNVYALTLKATDDNFIVSEEAFGFWKHTQYNAPVYDLIQENKPNSQLKILAESHKHKTPYYIAQAIQGWRVYHFDDVSTNSKKKRPQMIELGHKLDAEGDNIAAFLCFLKQNYVESYHQIVAVVRLAAPYFDDFVLQPEQPNENMVRLRWREKGKDKEFTASLISDGTLRFICLVTLLLQPNMPSTIVIDEPELGLHPLAITLLSELIKKASQNAQIIVSTQSVSLLNQFAPEDVLVVDKHPTGSSIKRLDSEQLTSWLEDYTLGELWESNVIGGRY